MVLSFSIVTGCAIPHRVHAIGKGKERSCERSHAVRRTARTASRRLLASTHTLRVRAQHHVRLEHDVDGRRSPTLRSFPPRQGAPAIADRALHYERAASQGPRECTGETAMNCKMWTIGLAMAATTVGTAHESLSMRVSPATAFAPANLVIRTRVEPDAANRAIEVIADGEDFLRSSMMQLEGDRAPKMAVFEFRSLPPGEYQVTASLIGADGKQRAMERTHVNVIASAASR
jgi:hypothetical protein